MNTVMNNWNELANQPSLMIDVCLRLTHGGIPMGEAQRRGCVWSAAAMASWDNHLIGDGRIDYDVVLLRHMPIPRLVTAPGNPCARLASPPDSGHSRVGRDAASVLFLSCVAGLLHPISQGLQDAMTAEGDGPPDMRRFCGADGRSEKSLTTTLATTTTSSSEEESPSQYAIRLHTATVALCARMLTTYWRVDAPIDSVASVQDPIWTTWIADLPSAELGQLWRQLVHGYERGADLGRMDLRMPDRPPLPNATAQV